MHDYLPLFIITLKSAFPAAEGYMSAAKNVDGLQEDQVLL